MSFFRTKSSQAPQSLNNGEAKATLNEFFETVIAGYNWLSRAIRSEEVNPLSQQYVEQTFASASNVTTGSTTYYPSSAGVSLGGYNDVSIHLYLSSSSGSIFNYIEATNDPATSPQWVDITKAAFIRNLNPGGAYVSGSSYAYFSVATGSTNFLLDLHDLNYSKFRIKNYIDYSNTNNTGIYIRMKAI